MINKYVLPANNEVVMQLENRQLLQMLLLELCWPFVHPLQQSPKKTIISMYQVFNNEDNFLFTTISLP